MFPFTETLHAAILIVDDQDANVRLLELILRRNGYVNVLSTTEPEQVCLLHRFNHYDLILLDLQMPRMNGFEVMAALSNQEGGAGKPPVLVLSADPSQRLLALEAGARDFLSKPLDLSALVLRVGSLLAEKAVPVLPPRVSPPLAA